MSKDIKFSNMKSNIYETIWLIAVYHLCTTQFQSWSFWLYVALLIISFPRWGACADWLKEQQHDLKMKRKHDKIREEVENDTTN